MYIGSIIVQSNGPPMLPDMSYSLGLIIMSLRLIQAPDFTSLHEDFYPG